MPSLLRAALLALVVLVPTAAFGAEYEEIYAGTAHADPVGGVSRLPTFRAGACRQCHSDRTLTDGPHVFGLFADPDDALCFTCHATPSDHAIFVGDVTYAGGSHATSLGARWPGPTPPERGLGDEGLCLNCHSPHGVADAGGLVPSLAVAREEALCLTCHDGTGPAATNVQAQLGLAAAHPVGALAGVHDAAEAITGASFAAGARRHAECVDCHNPHASTAGAKLAGTSRVAVTNGAANSVPTYSVRLGTDGSAVLEYQLCFKCHSSFTTLPAGDHDLGKELNPANASFHPIEAAGKNTTAAMTNNLAGGLGTPHLTTASTITCSDCHGSSALPTNVTVMSSYAGAEATGPHGSSSAVAVEDSTAILRARYRRDLLPRAAADNYARANFQLCFICHSPAPYEDRSGNSRNDTNFKEHGMHLRSIFDQGSVQGSITTAGAGRGNAICAECHYSLHGTADTYWSGNRTYERLVSFSPNITGVNGVGAPTWSRANRTCTLRCHGQNHSNEGY